MARTVSFWTYAKCRYLSIHGSVFLDGLVGGMFLTFLMDTEENCHDRSFTTLFFAIGITHFLSGIVENLAEYSEQAAEVDGTISPLEENINKVNVLLQQLLRIIQYPMVLGLGYYMLQFSGAFGPDWVHDMKELKPEGASFDNCTVCYCDGNYVHLGTLTFVFQLILGAVMILLWWVMWYVDREDDAKEREEEMIWRQKEAESKETLYGQLKGGILVIGMHSFFNEQVAAQMLALAVALPKENCNIDVMNWFLYAGIIYLLTGLLGKLRMGVEDMAAMDGIINKAEHRIILFLKFLSFPLFIFECVCFVAIFYHSIAHIGDITFERGDGEFVPDDYCEKGTWTLMLAVNTIYSLVFLFRLVVLLLALTGQEAETAKEPGLII